MAKYILLKNTTCAKVKFCQIQIFKDDLSCKSGDLYPQSDFPYFPLENFASSLHVFENAATCRAHIDLFSSCTQPDKLKKRDSHKSNQFYF